MVAELRRLKGLRFSTRTAHYIDCIFYIICTLIAHYWQIVSSFILFTYQYNPYCWHTLAALGPCLRTRLELLHDCRYDCPYPLTWLMH
ncbi:hypothetical protein PM082_024474 [Marasmius tenuissimus]|nr:hypothetical protein PM082_024474 [Marasmius tenuissimus]